MASDVTICVANDEYVATSFFVSTIVN